MRDGNQVTNAVSIILPAMVAIGAMIYTARKARDAIDRTAKSDRITLVHNELYKTLIETLPLLHESVILLHAVKNKVVFTDRFTDETIETAEDRYKRRIGTISKEFNTLVPRHKMLFPNKLNKCMNELMTCINQGREITKLYNDPNTIEAVNKASDMYKQFINVARTYVGPNELDPFTDIDMDSGIVGKETSKPG